MKKTLTLFVTFFSSLSVFASELNTVPHVDLQQYLGKWYEIAAIPQRFQKQCVGDTTAEYELTDQNLIKVVNSCETQSDGRSIAEGQAKVVDQTTNAKLKVTFVKLFDWVYFFGGDYWIIDLAADYSYAVVGHPLRKYAWVLARTPNLDKTTLQAIDRRLRENGYDTCQILSTPQKTGLETREALCKIVKE